MLQLHCSAAPRTLSGWLVIHNALDHVVLWVCIHLHSITADLPDCCRRTIWDPGAREALEVGEELFVELEFILDLSEFI